MSWNSRATVVQQSCNSRATVVLPPGLHRHTRLTLPAPPLRLAEPALFGKAGITSPSKCLAPAAAFSYTGLTTAVQRFKALGSNKDNASDPGVIEWAGPPTTWPSVDPDLTSLLGELKHYDGPTKLTAFPTL